MGTGHSYWGWTRTMKLHLHNSIRQSILLQQMPIQPTGLPDKQQSTPPDEQQSTTLKSAMKMSSTPARKKVSWSDKVNIMVDAETAYYATTQHA